jgi:hypothetical protein
MRPRSVLKGESIWAALFGVSDALRFHLDATAHSSFGSQLHDDAPDPGRLKSSRQKNSTHVRPYREVVRQDLIGAPQNIIHVGP